MLDCIRFQRITMASKPIIVPRISVVAIAFCVFYYVVLNKPIEFRSRLRFSKVCTTLKLQFTEL